MDRISRFPDEVLCHILSFLPTKHAVATSILSSRWLHLWSFLSIIDLDQSNPSRQVTSSELFFRSIDMVLSLNQSQTIKKFRLRVYPRTRQTSKINGFIQNVFLKNVVEIYLEIFGSDYELDEYLNIPHSQSLKVLKVRTGHCIKFPVFAGCFPSLRVFDLEVRVDEDDEWIRNLFPCLPALEKLSLLLDLYHCRRDLHVIVGGVALKHLNLELSSDGADYVFPLVVVIDAPKLEYLRLEDDFQASYRVMYKPAISEVRLDVSDFNKLLQGLVNAKFISVSATSLMINFSEGWNIPVLPSLTKLELDVNTSNWILLLHWLESCPNLKVLSLNIKAKPEEELEEVVPYVVSHVVPVPSCLSSCVKEINIKKIGKVDHEKILIYLLYNAKVLDRFTVDSHPYVKDGIVQSVLYDTSDVG